MVASFNLLSLSLYYDSKDKIRTKSSRKISKELRKFLRKKHYKKRFNLVSLNVVERRMGHTKADIRIGVISDEYKQAIESFQKLKEWYPFSKYASLAELKIADSYYHLEEYEDAVFAYKNFESLHPKNEAVPYVIFQIGTCYYEQMDTVDRDQSPARKALDTYTRLLRQFPDSDYSVKAAQRIKECQKDRHKWQ
jgi:tetratricopeptide (TPR) repeat protein